MIAAALDALHTRLASIPAPAVDCVHLWHLDDYSTDLSEARDVRVLTSSERARAARFHLDRDRRSFIAGRTALRDLLGAYLDRPPRSVAIIHGARGKPQLASEDNPAGLDFNVTHSGGHMICAITRLRAVGIDVERVRHLADLPSFARLVLTAEEWEAWSILDSRERLTSCLVAWVRKEAVLKGLGCGLAVRPTDIEVSLACGTLLTPVLPARLSNGRSWYLCDIGAQPGWVGALALEGAAGAMIVETRLTRKAAADTTATGFRSFGAISIE